MLKHVKTSMSIVKKCEKNMFQGPNISQHGPSWTSSHNFTGDPGGASSQGRQDPVGNCTWDMHQNLLKMAGRVATKSAENTRHSGIHGFLQTETWKQFETFV